MLHFTSNNIKFSENKFREDSIFFVKAIVYANNVSIIKDVLYFYRQHSKSVSKSFDNNWKDVLDVTYDVINFINSVEDKEDYLYEYLTYSVNSAIFWLSESLVMEFKHTEDLYKDIRRFFVMINKNYDINRIKCNINYHMFKKICYAPWLIFKLQLQLKKMFFTNGTHGVSIVKMCLLKNCFHERSYCAKEVIFSL